MLVSEFKSMPSNSRLSASPTLFTLALSWPSVEGSFPIPKYLFTNVSQCVVYGPLAYFIITFFFLEGEKEGFNFLNSAFVKYNFHTIKFTSFKCTVQWALTNVYSCIKSNRTFFVFDKKLVLCIFITCIFVYNLKAYF